MFFRSPVNFHLFVENLQSKVYLYGFSSSKGYVEYNTLGALSSITKKEASRLGCLVLTQILWFYLIFMPEAEGLVFI